MTAQPHGTTSPEIRRIAKAITDLQRQAKERTPQLAYTALEDGAIREFSGEEQVAQYGKQFDGTSAPAILVSPPPPAPSTPVVVGVPGGAKVFWNGTFENDITVLAPMDWARTDVTAGAVGMDPIATPPMVSITSPRGGEVFIPLVPGNYEVALISRTLAGRASEPSTVVAVTALALVDDAQFQEALDDITAAAGRLDTAETAIDDNVAEIDAAKARITATETNANNALANALTADNKAVAAQSAADAANTLAGLAQAKANAAITVYRQSSMPLGVGQENNDLWIDSDDGLLYVYQVSPGSGWTLSADQRIATVVTSNATKTTVFAQASQPPTSGRTIGDLWIDTDDGNRLYDWSGSWTVRALGAAAVNFTADQIGGAPRVLTAAGSQGKIFYNVMAYASSTPNLAGNLMISTPITLDNRMVTLRIKGYQYFAGMTDIDVTVSFYAYNNSLFLQTGYNNAGSMPVSVRVARAANNTAVIILRSEAPAPNANLWQYPKIAISEVQIGHTLPPDSWISGWSTAVVLEADIGTTPPLTAITAPPVYDAGAAAAAANALATVAKSTADGKITVFRQSSAPSVSGRTIGDLWIDSDDGLLYAWTGAWTLSADQRIATVVTSNAAKTTVFAQASQPSTSGRTIGDIWLDTDDGNKVYDWSGSWTVRLLGAPAISATARELGAVTIYRQSTAPASGMVTNDLWVDSDDGLLYIYAGSWLLSADQRIAAVVASDAIKTTLFAQTSTPSTTGRTIGDLWIDTDDNDRVYRWTGSAWVTTDLASTGYIASRATDLVTNGSAITRSTLNFSTFDFYADPPLGASGAFVTKVTTNAAYTIDENIAFDPTKKYRLSFSLKQTVAGAGSTNNAYGFLQPIDVDNNVVDPESYMYITGTMTTLAAPLNPGDTTVTLTSAANWYGQTGKPAGTSTWSRNVQFWDYVDGTGKLWPAGSYTRNRIVRDAYADGGVNLATGVITLRAPYAGPAHPAGTAVSQPTSGGSYLYMPTCLNVAVGTSWQAYSDIFSAGTMNPALQATPAVNAATWSTGVPPGTAKVKVGWLLNYAGSGAAGAGKMAVGLVSLSDASAAQSTADSAYTLASAKATVYRQSSAPTVGMATNDLWFDTDDGRVYVYNAGWQLSDDPRIGDALTNAAIAQAAAEKNDATNANPNFTDWSGALPNAWAAFGTGPTKETGTAYVRTLPNAARFNCTDATTDRGLYHALSDLPVGLQYVTVSIDIRLASGTTFGGAGILLDWTGMGGTNRVTWNFAADVPAPVVGKWYRLTKVLARPVAATGTQASWLTYLMAQYSAIGTARAVKDISVDRMAVRASSAEEISAYNSASAATVSSLTSTVNTKTTVFVQTSQPSTSGRTIGDLWLDSDDGNKPYDWTGSWTARQFGDSALANLDLNKLVVVGTANLNVAVANEIAAKTASFQTADIKNLFVTDGATLNDVVAQRIASDVGEFITVRANNLESVMAMVTTLTSGGTGRRWEAGPDGIRVYESDGSILINFPTDPDTPSSFYGDLVATSLTVADQLAIRGLVNEISKGAQLVLASGTTAPSGPPSVVIDWEAIDTRFVDGDPSYDSFNSPRYGWARWAGYWWTAQTSWGSPAALHSYDDNGNRVIASVQPVTQNLQHGTGGVTVLGANIYVMGKRQMADFSWQWWIEGFSPAGARIAQWQYIPSSNSREPKIGNDGTNLIIAYSTTTENKLRWQSRNPTTGAVVASFGGFTTLAKEMGAMWHGSADFGGSRIIFTGVGDPTACVSTGSAYSPNENFSLPTGNIQGIDWDGTVFWSHDAVGYKLYKHTTHKWTTESALWWISNTWYDSNATGGTHETAQGPRKSFTMKKRARLQVTTGLIPVRPIPNTTDDAVAARLYLGRGAADPGRTSMERAATLADGLRNGIILTHTFPAAGAAINPPPAASDFPATSPGRIISADSTTIILNGDGTGNLGTSHNAPVVGAGGVVTGVPRCFEGSSAVPIVAAGAASANIVVTFPAGRFTANPKFFVTTASGRLTAYVVSVTTTGATFAFNNWSPAASSATTAYWFAIQST